MHVLAIDATIERFLHLFDLTRLRLVIHLGETMFSEESIDLIRIPQMVKDLAILRLANSRKLN